MYLAEELVTSGGPTAPAWAFFTAITLALIGVIAQQIAARRAANEAKIEAAKAASNAQQAKDNTAPLANGFASRIDFKLDAIRDEQAQTNGALRKHLEWHLDNDK